jgi:hypothetical protein
MQLHRARSSDDLATEETKWSVVSGEMPLGYYANTSAAWRLLLDVVRRWQDPG